MRAILFGAVSATALALCGAAQADENLFGYVRGAETLPKGAWEVYQWTTVRDDKGVGEYQAIDTDTEVEYGLSDRFTVSGAIETLSIDTSGIVIDGYLPGPKSYTLRPSAIEVSGKYNFLRPAADGFGLSGRFAMEYGWLDRHSGEDKTVVSAETDIIAQRYFMEGQLIWVGNVGLEASYDDREPIAGLPVGFDWPTDPEMEIELKLGTAVSYRFAPNWFIGAETTYETEFETEVGQERWSWFAGPSIHYGGERWWGTFTWYPQIAGGGETYPGQTEDLHLIEKTKQEFRLKLGVNF